LKFAPGLLAAAVLSLLALRCVAAEPIDTDGPDFVDSSEVVGTGRFQYELELSSEQNRRGADRSSKTSTPTLLKYGISNDIELRLETEGYVRLSNEDAGVASLRTGVGDTALGLKWHSQDRNSESGAPAVSWIAQIDAPSGTDGLGRRGYRPSLRSVWTWDLPHELALGVMPGIKSDTNDAGGRFTSGIFGAVLNRRVTESFRAFVEFSASRVAHGRDGGALADWDIGAAYLLTRDTQIGARTGVAANLNTPSGFVMVELAQRF
jgi:hypothetical protein